MERIDDEVRRSLGTAGVPDAGVLADVVRAWPSAVGPAIARAAWPTRVGRDGTLHVATASATWAFELGHLADGIRSKLEAHLGEATPPVIRFAPGPLPTPGPPAEKGRAAPRPTEDDDRLATAIASAVDDDALRELVRRAAAASLAGRRSGRSF